MPRTKGSKNKNNQHLNLRQQLLNVIVHQDLNADQNQNHELEPL